MATFKDFKNHFCLKIFLFAFFVKKNLNGEPVAGLCFLCYKDPTLEQALGLHLITRGGSATNSATTSSLYMAIHGSQGALLIVTVPHPPGASWLPAGRPAGRQVLRHGWNSQDRQLPRLGEVGPTGGYSGRQHAQGQVDHLRM